MKDWVWIILMLAGMAFIIWASWNIEVKRVEPEPVRYERPVGYVMEANIG